MLTIVGNRTLTDDVLCITLCSDEKILISRDSDEPDDFEALTPNHFLLGRGSPATPFISDDQRHTDLRRFRCGAEYHKHSLI